MAPRRGSRLSKYDIKILHVSNTVEWRLYDLNGTEGRLDKRKCLIIREE